MVARTAFGVRVICSFLTREPQPCIFCRVDERDANTPTFRVGWATWLNPGEAVRGPSSMRGLVMEAWESRLYGGKPRALRDIGRFVPEVAEPGQAAGQSNVAGRD